MDWGVWSWERIGMNIPFKPMAATQNITEGIAGYRVTNAGTFLADADPAWHIYFDENIGAYRLLDNDEFHNIRRLEMGEVMRKLGHENSPVLHGPHMNVELMFRKQGKTAADFNGKGLEFFKQPKYYKADVAIYGRDFQGQTGFIEIGKMEASLNTGLFSSQKSIQRK